MLRPDAVISREILSLGAELSIDLDGGRSIFVPRENADQLYHLLENMLVYETDDSQSDDDGDLLNFFDMQRKDESF